MPAHRDRPLSAELDALGAAVAKAKARARDAEFAQSRADGEVARLKDATIAAYADGDEARAAKASKERDNAERTTLRDAQERLEGAKRAVATAEAAHGLFAREHADELLSERYPDAEAVAEAAEDAVAALGQPHAVWNATYAEISTLLRLAGRNTGTMPAFPAELERLTRAPSAPAASASRSRCPAGRGSRSSRRRYPPPCLSRTRTRSPRLAERSPDDQPRTPPPRGAASALTSKPRGGSFPGSFSPATARASNAAERISSTRTTSSRAPTAAPTTPPASSRYAQAATAASRPHSVARVRDRWRNGHAMAP